MICEYAIIISICHRNCTTSVIPAVACRFAILLWLTALTVPLKLWQTIGRSSGSNRNTEPDKISMPMSYISPYVVSRLILLFGARSYKIVAKNPRPHVPYFILKIGKDKLAEDRRRSQLRINHIDGTSHFLNNGHVSKLGIYMSIFLWNIQYTAYKNRPKDTQIIMKRVYQHQRHQVCSF